MTDSLNLKPVTLQLSDDQALVLFELLARFEETNHLKLNRNAEFIALSALSGELQAKVVDPFNPNYKTLLAQAYERLETGFEGLAPGVEP